MDLGRKYDASFSSSDRWHAESPPIKVITGPVIPTRHESAILPQLPLSWKSVQTSLVGDRGPMTQSTTMKATNPMQWNITTTPSAKGSFLTRTVFQVMAKRTTAMLNSVPCHPKIV